MSNIFEAFQRAQQENPTDMPSPLPGNKDNASPIPADAPSPSSLFLSAQAEEYRAVAQEGVQPADPIRVLPVHMTANAPILPFDGVDPRAGEHYRIIRTKIVQHPSRPRVCAITSPGPGDGKTITSINLAGALALRNDAKVVLVDADLRRPAISHLLGFPQEPGLADILSGTCTVDDALVRVEQLQSLYVIPAGRPPVNPTELLDSGRLTSVLATLRARFRFVILDVPPFSSVADYDLIQAEADGIVLVVRPDHTNRTLCFKALEVLPKQKFIGVAINCAADWFLWKTSSYYYYY